MAARIHTSTRSSHACRLATPTNKRTSPARLSIVSMIVQPQPHNVRLLRWLWLEHTHTYTEMIVQPLSDWWRKWRAYVCIWIHICESLSICACECERTSIQLFIFFSVPLSPYIHPSVQIFTGWRFLWLIDVQCILIASRNGIGTNVD